MLYIIQLTPKLGFYNVFYALYYKISLKYKFRRYKFITKDLPKGSYFTNCASLKETLYIENAEKTVQKGRDILNGKFTYFFYHNFILTNTSIWFYDPFNKKEYRDTNKHWTSLNDFGDHDIKVIWEQSRFYWLIDLAKAYRVSNDEAFLYKINFLLNDWCEKNPVNIGPNWKCGQETSIRVFNIMYSLHILDQLLTPSESLKELIFLHLERIIKNINYAIIQDNNHGTSEASALFIGGAWLESCNYKKEIVKKWKQKGKSILEERILKLVQKEGSFSQRSNNYHRVFIDTMTFTLFMMEKLSLTSFSTKIKERLRRAGELQIKMTFGENGEAPNYGSNDGAMLNILHNKDYSDSRPSTQSFFGVLDKKFIYDDKSLYESLFWLYGEEINYFNNVSIKSEKIEVLDNHILLIKNKRVNIFLKIPDTTFRPGNDAFHIDVWLDKNPICIDSGTYSYNDNLTEIFKSVKAHNTAQFSSHEQMPKVGKFLNAKWIAADEIYYSYKNGVYNFNGTYTDYRGNRHTRKLTLDDEKLKVYDSFDTNEEVTLRYRFAKDLKNISYTVENAHITSKKCFTSDYYFNHKETDLLELKPKSIDMETVFQLNF